MHGMNKTERLRTLKAVRTGVDHVGGVSAMSRKLGTSRALVRYYLKTGVPAKRCRAFEAACDGVATRWELDPETFGPSP